LAEQVASPAAPTSGIAFEPEVVVVAAGGDALAEGIEYVVDGHIHEHLVAGANPVVLDGDDLAGVIAASPHPGVELGIHDSTDVEDQVGVTHQDREPHPTMTSHRA